MSRLLKGCAGRYSLWFLVACIYILPLMAVRGAFDAFLKIEGVPGESADAKHKDWIIIESVSHQMGRSITGSGTNRVVGPVYHGEVTFTKKMDKSTPLLAQSVCSGIVHPKVEISILRATTNNQQSYLTYKLSDVLVSSFAPNGSSQGGDPAPTESISLNYTKIEWSYGELDTITGSTNNVVEVSCDGGGSGLP